MKVLAKRDKEQKPVSFNINEEIKRAISIIKQRLASNNIKLITELETSTPFIKGHPTQIVQVIINLLVNAIDVLKKQDKDDKIITLTSQLTDKNLIIRVIDNGPGIPKKHINHIFDPFFTTKVGEEGMGFGLSIVQNIISSMGGTIKAENNKDEGARFIVLFPVTISEKLIRH